MSCVSGPSPLFALAAASAAFRRAISLFTTSFDVSFLIVRTRVAYVSEFCVSSRLSSVGETFTNISVFAFPPKLSDMSIVSLWSR
eukprot:31056-Pelagococcus_subviridis.AAC.3